MFAAGTASFASRWLRSSDTCWRGAVLCAKTLAHVPSLRRSCVPQGVGVYRFQDKYGANVDGYSPIYTPDQWTESGDSYSLGTKGLIAW